MEHVKTLRDLGFRSKSRRKNRSKKNNGKKPSIQPPTSTTLEGLLNRYQNMNRNLPADAPPDPGLGSSGQTDMLEKGEDGFENYLSGRWKTGYPI